MKAILHTPPKPSDPIKQKAGEGCSGAPCSPGKLAEKIAKRLYTDGSGTEATRLELKLGNHNPTQTREEKSLGGWCFNAAVDQIQKILEENVSDQATASGRLR